MLGVGQHCNLSRPQCRLMFFDQTREAAEREHKANPKDALVRVALGADVSTTRRRDVV